MYCYQNQKSLLSAELSLMFWITVHIGKWYTMKKYSVAKCHCLATSSYSRDFNLRPPASFVWPGKATSQNTVHCVMNAEGFSIHYMIGEKKLLLIVKFLTIQTVLLNLASCCNNLNHNSLFFIPLWWCIIHVYPWWFCNLEWLRPAGLYERYKLVLELKRLKTSVLSHPFWPRDRDTASLPCPIEACILKL